MPTKVFDDSNFRDLITQGTVFGLGGEPRPAGYNSSFAKPFGSRFQRIPRSDWSARIAEQKAKKRRVSDFQKFKPHAQTGPTCWANGPAHAATTKRVMMGYSLVYLSANSIAVPISGGTSGGYEGEAVKMMIEDGIASVATYPNGSRDRSLLRDQSVIDDRNHFHVLEALELDGFDDFATAALLGQPFAVAFNWWSHVISGGDLVEIEKGSYGIMYRNNWGQWQDDNDYGFSGYVTMREGKGTPSSGWVIYEMTPYASA